MTYYDQNRIVVRSSTIEDVKYLSTRLKTADVKEIWDSHNHTPEQALRISLEKSYMCLTIDDNGKPVGMFGTTSETMLSENAVVWLLTSNDINKIKIRFLRHCKYFISLMLENFNVLYNMVSEDNAESIGWLRHLGAKMGVPVKFGVEQKMFIPFWFERKP